MSTVPIQDMSNTYIEHSEVITNFVTSVYSQLKGNVCRVYPDNVQYKCIINGEEKKVIPDASINCRVHAKRGNSFLIFLGLLWRFYLLPQKNMIVEKRWSYTVNRK